jgi:ubiquinone/menaquinone biosynthesis C-methylase UbiE
MRAWPPVPDFPDDAFSGTARAYADYRPPYPQALLNDLLTRTGHGADSRLLDLGCGPGRVALAMARHFRETWAVDPEQEMIEEGRRRTPDDLARRLRWIRSRAEDLRADQGSFRLVTIGEAFHRMNQRSVAGQVLRWLVPGGWLAILWYEHIWQGAEDWKRRVTEVLSRYKKTGPSPAKGEAPWRKFMSFEEVLRATGFQNVRQREFREPRLWQTEQLIGYLYSVSVYSRRMLGDRVDDFEVDVRRALAETDAGGQYAEIATFGCLSARRSEG